MTYNLFKYITKKTIIFGVAGALGALIGNVTTEFFLKFNNNSFLSNLMHVMLWTATISLGIAISLLIAQNIYFKKTILSKSLLKGGFRGVFTGAIAGGIAQIIFAYTSQISELIEIISRIACWGIFGLGTGWGVSVFVPNFSKKTAMLAGFIGGVIGGAAFRFSFILIPEIASRLFGVAILGFFIGLTISYIEELLREAWLSVEYSKDETILIALGAKPIVFGSSSEADIYLPKEKNYPPITAIVEVVNSKIIIENKINGTRTELRNGSKIGLGTINVIVNTR